MVHDSVGVYIGYWKIFIQRVMDIFLNYIIPDFINITINLIRKKKYLRTGKRYQAHGGSNKFSKILLFTCLLKFYHWQQILVIAFFK